MNFANVFMKSYGSILHFVAEFTVYTLELVGILIIIIGSLRALIQLLSNLKNKHKTNIVINLGNTQQDHFLTAAFFFFFFCETKTTSSAGGSGKL